MNRAQKVVVWIIAVCLFVVTEPFYREVRDYGWREYSLGYIIAYLFILIPGIALLLTLKKTEGSDKSKQNWKRGGFRIALALSIFVFLLFAVVGIWNIEGLIIGGAIAGGIWLVYLTARFIFVPVVCWIIRGFDGS